MFAEQKTSAYIRCLILPLICMGIRHHIDLCTTFSYVVYCLFDYTIHLALTGSKRIEPDNPWRVPSAFQLWMEYTSLRDKTFFFLFQGRAKDDFCIQGWRDLFNVTGNTWKLWTSLSSILWPRRVLSPLWAVASLQNLHWDQILMLYLSWWDAGSKLWKRGMHIYISLRPLYMVFKHVAKQFLRPRPAFQRFGTCMQEEVDVTYKSKVDGKMHACKCSFHHPS